MKSLKIIKVIPTKVDLSTVIHWLSTENAIFLRVEQAMVWWRIHKGCYQASTARGARFAAVEG